MENSFRSMKSSSDGCERSVMFTRRTATVIISAPLRLNAATISSLSRYFPVPMIRRELNSRPAIMSLSFIKQMFDVNWSEEQVTDSNQARSDAILSDVFPTAQSPRRYMIAIQMQCKNMSLGNHPVNFYFPGLQDAV